MFRNIGWAAFLASSVSLVVFGAAAAANAGRPTYACFSPQNAAAIGRLGANDASVRYGFESGECLALPVGVPLTDIARQGNLWRFRAFGARPFLYAANWAAGFQASDEQAPPGFERYLPVTAQLLASGRTYAQCYDDGEKLSRRIVDHERRVREYERWGNARPEGSTPKVVIYVGDAGPRLAAEAEQLRRESAALDRRCSTVAAMEADDDFVAFVRTAQNA
jgi:hypothetical protein